MVKVEMESIFDGILPPYLHRSRVQRGSGPPGIPSAPLEPTVPWPSRPAARTGTAGPSSPCGPPAPAQTSDGDPGPSDAGLAQGVCRTHEDMASQPLSRSLPRER